MRRRDDPDAADLVPDRCRSLEHEGRSAPLVDYDPLWEEARDLWLERKSGRHCYHCFARLDTVDRMDVAVAAKRDHEIVHALLRFSARWLPSGTRVLDDGTDAVAIKVAPSQKRDAFFFWTKRGGLAVDEECDSPPPVLDVLRALVAKSARSPALPHLERWVATLAASPAPADGAAVAPAKTPAG